MSNASVSSKVGRILRDLSGRHSSKVALTKAIDDIREETKYEKMDPDMRAIVADITIELEKLRDRPSADPYDQFLEIINRFLTETAQLGLTKFANRDALLHLL